MLRDWNYVVSYRGAITLAGPQGPNDLREPLDGQLVREGLNGRASILKSQHAVGNVN
jgi:hypothetical protein